MLLNGIVASFLVVLIQVRLCKPPIVIPPQNPNDPLTLATGTSRNVLVIGLLLEFFVGKKTNL